MMGGGSVLKAKLGTVVPLEFEKDIPIYIFLQHENHAHSYIRSTGLLVYGA
jgi:hypothetical protein